MKTIFLMATLIIFTSCIEQETNASELPNQSVKEQELMGYKFKCFSTGGDESMTRCENEEAVCYWMTGHRRGGLSCKFKK